MNVERDTYVFRVSKSAELVLSLPLLRPVVEEEGELRVFDGRTHWEVEAGYQMALLVAGE